MNPSFAYPNPTPIYHITPIDNLRLIFEAGGMWAKRVLDQEDTDYTNMAHQSIQDRRAKISVPCTGLNTARLRAVLFCSAFTYVIYYLQR